MDADGKFLTILLLAVLATLALGFPAFADGALFPREQVEKLPEIPQQRALITYQGGVETLVIQNTFKGEGDSFAWLVPVPAAPTEMRAVSPGLIDTLALNVTPRYDAGPGKKGRYYGETRFVLGCVAGVLMWSLAMVLLRRRVELDTVSGISFTVVLLLVCILVPNFVLAGNIHQMLNTTAGEIGGSEAVAGISVKAEGLVGDYDVALLEAEKPEALSRWLRLNGFKTLPVEGEPIVQAYIDEGWKFVAAKLVGDALDGARPRPVALTFPSEKIVYPMRLTALSGVPLRLELFVAAGLNASCPPLKIECAGELKADEYDDDLGMVYTTFKGDRYMPDVMHPAAGEFLSFSGTAAT